MIIHVVSKQWTVEHKDIKSAATRSPWSEGIWSDLLFRLLKKTFWSRVHHLIVLAIYIHFLFEDEMWYVVSVIRTKAFIYHYSPVLSHFTKCQLRSDLTTYIQGRCDYLKSSVYFFHLLYYWHLYSGELSTCFTFVLLHIGAVKIIIWSAHISAAVLRSCSFHVKNVAFQGIFTLQCSFQRLLYKCSWVNILLILMKFLSLSGNIIINMSVYNTVPETHVEIVGNKLIWIIKIQL